MAVKNIIKSHTKNEYRLTVGDIIIGIITPSKKNAEAMENYFGIENSKKKPDIQLIVNPVYHENSIDIPDSLFNYKKVNSDKFIMGNDIVTGYFSDKKRSGELNVKTGITSGPAIRVFEQVLYQAFYTACKIKKSNSILIHSTGAIYKNSGFLFTGPSGSGKSTIANLNRKYHVLNDEICLLTTEKDKIYLHYSPFNGFFRKKKPGNALLKAIFCIEHGRSHKIVDIKESTVIKLLAKEIIPPIGLNETITTSTFADMIDTAKKLHDKVIVKKLEFLPDNGFWKEIDKLFFK